MRGKINLFAVFLVILLDQLSKFLAPKVGFTVVKNTGIAFGLFPNFAWGITIVFILVAFLINFFKKKRNQLPATAPSPRRRQSLWRRTAKLWSVGDSYQLPATLVLGGGLSNLLDRLFCGYIRDFIDLKIWPVFNLADVAICLGVGLLLLQQIKSKKLPS